MKKLDKKAADVIAEIKKMGGDSTDITTRDIRFKHKKVSYIYFESVTSDDKVSNYLMRSLSQDVKEQRSWAFQDIFKLLKDTIPNSKIKTVEDYDDLFYYLASGFTCLLIDGFATGIVMETKSKLDRGVAESTDEKTLLGPKDSFTENHLMNIGLIRKRIKDPNLWFQDVIVGKRTKTKVTISFVQDIVQLDKVDEIKKKLSKIDIDGILDSGYIRELLFTKQHSSFPKIISTERPDLTSGALLEGKIVILVENSPYVLILPGLLMDFIHTADDYYQKPSNVSLSRILRFICFIATLITPALYIAVTTFNQEIIPDRLLISLAVQREGVPFPTAFELLALQITFEILRESDIRMPNAMGSAVSIVGALVLGDAAVSAGIVSPIAVIIVAITSISGLLFTNIDLINALRWWRVAFLIMASLVGLIGIIAVGIIFIAKLASLESLDTPYLTPLSPFNSSFFTDGFIRIPRNLLTKRPSYLTKKNTQKIGVDTSEN